MIIILIDLLSIVQTTCIKTCTKILRKFRSSPNNNHDHQAIKEYRKHTRKHPENFIHDHAVMIADMIKY